MTFEPIQAEGGDKHASASYFRELRALAKEFNVLLIVDEVHTGLGSSGKMWCLEHWNMEDPADIVVSSKKAQIGGFFFKRELMPETGYRIFNTWMGDPLKMLALDTIIDVIEQEDLLARDARERGCKAGWYSTRTRVQTRVALADLSPLTS